MNDAALGNVFSTPTEMNTDKKSASIPSSFEGTSRFDFKFD